MHFATVSPVLCLLSLALQSEAATLFVASYAGTLTTIDVSGHASQGRNLRQITQSDACAIPGSPPSWITLDAARDTLYCTNPGVDLPSGKLISIHVQRNGSLATLDTIDVPIYAAHSAIYNRGDTIGIAY